MIYNIWKTIIAHIYIYILSKLYVYIKKLLVVIMKCSKLNLNILEFKTRH